MKWLALIVIALIPAAAFADGALSLDGKLYVVVEQEKKKCAEPGSPEYAAQLMLIDIAQKNGELLAKSTCTLKPDFCDPAKQIRFGVEQVFAFVRIFPFRFSSSGCSSLRDECQRRCEATKLFADQECFVECNQYETYNKK